MNRNARLRRRLLQRPCAWYSPAQRSHRSDTRLHWHVPRGTQARSPRRVGSRAARRAEPSVVAHLLFHTSLSGKRQLAVSGKRQLARQPARHRPQGAPKGSPRPIGLADEQLGSQRLPGPQQRPKSHRTPPSPATLHHASVASRSGVMGSISRIREPSAKNVSGLSRACLDEDRAWLRFLLWLWLWQCAVALAVAAMGEDGWG